MLEVRNLSVSYGQHRALDGVSINVEKGEIVVILGANGAGKSSLLRAVGGMSEGTASGEVSLDGDPVAGLPPHEIVERGIALVPEGRGVFPDLSVRENLLLGAYTARARENESTNLDRVQELFPKLAERHDQVVRTMSGGEQQMVAIGRAMMSSPQILMLDEPSLGLSPLLCKELFHSLTEVRKSGLGILLVEQNAKQSLAIADRGYLLENAQITGENSAQNLANDPSVQQAYLGVSGGPAKAPPVVRPAAAAAEPTAALAAAKAAAASALSSVADAGAAVNGHPAAAPPSSSLSFVAPGQGQSRARTDEVVTGGIDGLVDRAATLHSGHYGKEAVSDAGDGRRTSTARQGPSNGLAKVLSDIEEAARRARLPATPTEKPDSQPKPAPQAKKPADDPPELFDDLPEVEVWKREPEIEIYRRDGGKLRRVKED